MIGKNISIWYKEHGRKDLPWRLAITPYKIWISELILQQTQVKTGIEYFHRFISKYPTLGSIKDASEDDILGLWKGLGYYRRANYIFQAKEMIFKTFNGVFPESYDDLVQLPGIGQSTAGAILSIAYNKPYPILDGNVKRLISRYFHKKHFDEKVFWDLSKQLIDQDDPFSFQQGAMDIGATICVPAKPLCNLCPLKKACKSFKINSFPRLSKKRVVKKQVNINFQIIVKGKKIAMTKNNNLGFWKNLWLFPHEIVRQNKPTIVHNLSHRKLNIEYIVSSETEKATFFSFKEVLNLTTPKPISDRLLEICR
ncbi:MAG: A/G-specific adenine glycosylase [Proteobacteria bacterium]|nr:A/G-specific adenine glycosylase [Pseudomonadota bacterium]